MATIVLSRIGFEGRHGASAVERRTTRRFEVDVELELPLEVAQSSDRLADTVDFRSIAATVVSLGGGEPHHLLESLADAMATALRKLSPPYCAGNPAFSAVRLCVPAAV